VANKITSINTTHKAGSALDQFLPERMFAVHAEKIASATSIDPAEIHLEPIAPRSAAAASPVRPRAAQPSSEVQAWPMVAAAMVAIGVSLLAFAMLAKFGLP